ncbi:MAG: hypothetical protein R3B82_26645 [Sandaracinaceae bacterium]
MAPADDGALHSAVRERTGQRMGAHPALGILERRGGNSTHPSPSTRPAASTAATRTSLSS